LINDSRPPMVVK